MAPGTDLSALASEIERVHNTSLVPQKKIEFSLKAPTNGPVVVHASTITKDFDELRFEAAAFHQLSVSGYQVKPTDSSRSHPQPSQHQSSLLISSPYNDPGHYLDLSTLDTSDLIFAKALTALKPTREDYATAPYTSALNFSSVLSLIRTLSAAENHVWKEHTFYVVIFRS